MKLKPQQSTSKQKKEEEIFLIPTNKIKGKRWQSFSLVFHLHIFVFICASVDISIIPLELYLNFHKQQKVSKIFFRLSKPITQFGVEGSRRKFYEPQN